MFGVQQGVRELGIDRTRANSQDGINLLQNYPNPFNPSTKISYQIPELSFITLKIYGVLGNEITTLVKEQKPVGTYEATFNAAGLPSGVYFYTLQASILQQVQEILLKPGRCC